MKDDKTISVIGMGRLGAPLAASFISKGHHVIGVDINKDIIESVNKGVAPVFEPGLASLFRDRSELVRATDDYKDAVLNTGITFVLVPTPSDSDGGFSLRHVMDSCENIAGALGEKDDYHLVVITSTVLPGSMDNEIRPLMEERSGKSCGVDFGLCYNPEFVALGSVLHDLRNPDFILIGESDPRSGDILESLYRETCESEPGYARMSFINAELTKLAVNTYITTKITFANTLARVCERLPGADVDTVTSALGLDSRIGRKYLKGAIGYGGPCFPRDNVAFTYLASRLGLQAALASATDEVNRKQVSHLLEIVRSNLVPEGVVGILGLTYKADTNVVEESQGLLLARQLLNDGIPVAVHDPQGMDNAHKVLGDSVRFAGSARECIDQSDIVVIATPWKEFRQISPDAFSRQGDPRFLIDCWGVLDEEEFRTITNYMKLGVWEYGRKE